MIISPSRRRNLAGFLLGINYPDCSINKRDASLKTCVPYVPTYYNKHIMYYHLQELQALQ